MNSIFIIVRTTDTAAASATTPTPLGSRPGPCRSRTRVAQKRPGRFTKRAIALLLACVVVGGAAGAGGAAAYQQITKPDTVVYQGERPTVDVDTVANSNDGQPMTPEQLYAANLASCVGITVNTTVNIFGQTTTSAASGSGFVLTQTAISSPITTSLKRR